VRLEIVVVVQVLARSQKSRQEDLLRCGGGVAGLGKGSRRWADGEHQLEFIALTPKLNLRIVRESVADNTRVQASTLSRPSGVTLQC
jgi:hypothetical protein